MMIKYKTVSVKKKQKKKQSNKQTNAYIHTHLFSKSQKNIGKTSLPDF